ncbi:hypothetical protein BN13_2070001 [Nostocoides jenkinsii Ben 74]|uniref:Uncharacterized protein n=1 Tax=Nostocoides jenkinsii Ben 74 TaxID=1193518 RepID=A0A077MD31_9MICO|nr:hypothetical protein BN13_2070001 [Tetrasphaera jenkinsii Ben 74]
MSTFFYIDTLLGIPLPVSPPSLVGKSNVYGALTGPDLFVNMLSPFLCIICFSMSVNFFPNLSKAASGSLSFVHSGDSRCPR